MRVPGNAQDAARALSAAPGVEYAEVDKILTAQAASVPNDPRFAEQYGTTGLGGGYTFGSGISAATPYVAGVAAVMRKKYPTYTAAQIRNLLASTADDLGAPGRDSYFGFGRVTCAGQSLARAELTGDLFSANQPISPTDR